MARPRSSRPRGNIRDLGQGRWLVRVSLGEVNGHRRRFGKVIRGTKKEAQQYLTEQLRAQDTGVLRQAPPKYTLAVWMEEYCRVYRMDVDARTRADTEALTKRYLEPSPLWARKLTAVSPTDVMTWVNDLSARGLSPRTVRMAHGVLRHALNQAVALGYLPLNPATIGVKLPKQPPRQVRAMSRDQAMRFLDAAREDRWYPLFLLLLTGGLRPAEALALRWEDLEGSVIRVRRSLVRLAGQPYRLKEPKTGRGRAVPLPSMTVRALDAFRAGLPTLFQEPGAFMFATADGHPVEHCNLAARHFKPILQRAGLPAHRLYDLRHTCATLLLANGEHPKVVSERLGHGDITLTLNTYTHVLPGMQEEAAAKLDAMLKPVLKLA